jgi:heptosyltransferase-1
VTWRPCWPARECIVGLDTGFTHLAAALGRPTIGIYCDHEPGLAGVVGPGSVHSLGGKGQVPKLADVLALLEAQHGTAPVPR